MRPRPNQLLQANRRRALRFISRGPYYIFGFGRRPLPAPVAEHFRSAIMRIALLILLFVATRLFAVSIAPNVNRSAAVLTGTVLSVQKIAVETDKHRFKYEIWRAEVGVQRITKQDTNVVDKVFLYYNQTHRGEDGTSYLRLCPGYPNIAVGSTNTFYCIRRDAGDAKRVLFIPESAWVTAP